MKVCKKCESVKPFSEFGKNSSKKDGLQDWCKVCKNAHHRAYYQDNRDRFIAYTVGTKAKLREWYHELKSGPCQDCGIDWPPYVKHFHHRDPDQKLGEVSRILRTGNKKLVLEEVAKCDLLCGNCHAIREHAPVV